MCGSVFAGVYRHDTDVRMYKDLAAQPQFECAGQVINKHMAISGSCVLIGDRFVLCAAHVFMTADQLPPDTMKHNGSIVLLSKYCKPRVDDIENYTFRFGRQIGYGKSLIIHPVYLDSLHRGSCDIVIIELKEPIIGIAPAILGSGFDELNSLVTGIGWGASGKANEPQNVSIWFEEIAGRNIIDSVIGYVYNGKHTLLRADFDHPSNYKDCNKTGKPEPVQLEYLPSGGDSGGGLFRQNEKGVWELIGICTGAGVDIQQLLKTGYYGQLCDWTRVSVFRNWINETVQRLKK